MARAAGAGSADVQCGRVLRAGSGNDSDIVRFEAEIILAPFFQP